MTTALNEPIRHAAIVGFFEKLGISVSSEVPKPPLQPVPSSSPQPKSIPIYMPGLSANTKVRSK